MRFYSDQPLRRRNQIVADVLVVLWVLFWCWQGLSIQSSIHESAEPTRAAERITTGLGQDLTDIGEMVSAVPLLGSSMGSAIASSTLKVQELAALSGDATEMIEGIGWRAGVGVALTPTILMLACYLPGRIRFVRRANDPGPVDPELLALRALLTQPSGALHGAVTDPVDGWRRRDPAIIHQLAQLQMEYDGLRVPDRSHTGSAG